MKNKYTRLMLPFFLLLLSIAETHAQDSSKSVIKKINASSEQADNLHGKKIQQKSLSGQQFEKLAAIDTITKTTLQKAVKRKKQKKQQH